MACCLFVWLVVVGLLLFFDTGHMIVNIGWVGYYYKAWTMQMESGTVNGFSSAIVREDPASQRCLMGTSFSNKKKPNFFGKKNWGGVWERKMPPHFRHVDT